MLLVKCPEGTFFNDEEECIPCPEGTYQDDEGKTACINCPEGTWTLGNQAANQTECIGMFNSVCIHFIVLTKLLDARATLPKIFSTRAWISG